MAEQLEIVSVREARRFQTEGEGVVPGTSPRDAPTLALGQQYATDARDGEQHFYRYEVPPGVVVDVEATREPVPNVNVSGVLHVRFGVEVMDRDGNRISCHCPGRNPEYGLHDLAEAQLRAIRESGEPAETEATDVDDEVAATPIADDGGGVPGWAVAVIALLTVLVLVLGALMVMMMRRQQSPGSPPPPSA